MSHLAFKLLALFCALSRLAAGQAHYLVTEIPVDLGGDSAFVSDLTENGQILFTRQSPLVGSPLPHNAAFVWSATGLRELPPFAGYDGTIGSKVFENGRVVGSCTTDGPAGSYPEQPVTWTQDNVIQRLRLPEGVFQGSALDSNSSGQIVGYCAGSPLQSPLLWWHGVLVPLALPAGANGGFAAGINEHGLIAGAAVLSGSNTYRPVLWLSPNQPLVLDLPPTATGGGGLNDVNAAGWAVGNAHFGGSGGTKPIRYDDRGLRLLALPQGWQHGFLYAINRSGLAVGNVLDALLTVSRGMIADGDRVVLIDELLDPATGAGWEIEALGCVNNHGQMATLGRQTLPPYRTAILRLDPIP